LFAAYCDEQAPRPDHPTVISQVINLEFTFAGRFLVPQAGPRQAP
jgi:hypothetical protein